MAMKRGAEGGDGYGPAAKRHGKGGGSGVPRTRHAFKVLAPDSLAAMLLGTRGAFKDEIQNETGTKLVFSNRGDYFPGSQYRVLGVYADDVPCINKVFDWIIPKIVDLGEEERKNPPKDGAEFLGKEPGEFIFRFTVTKRMSSHIIGAGGCNIKQIRHETGAKVFIDNETKMDHQLCRVIGLPEQILPCMVRLNDFVQEECDEQDFFTAFAGIVNFGDSRANWAPAAEPWSGGGTGGSPASSWKGKAGKGAAGVGAKSEGRGVVVPPRINAKGSAAVDSENVQEGSVQEQVDGLADTLSAFVPGTQRLEYSVACGLPPEHLGLLLDNEGEYVKYVEEATGTTIDIEGEESSEPDTPRPMTVVGQLLNVYAAHAMVLLKLRAAEAREHEEEERRAAEQADDPEVLKARIQELQAQLAKVSGQAS